RWLFFPLIKNDEREEAQGEFTSPCYPQKYPNSQACKWTMQAPPGFIIQLSFLDFDLEEAPACMYDWVMVNTGSTDVKFCGLTASGLTLNSTGNVMELSFTSDFSPKTKVTFLHYSFRFFSYYQLFGSDLKLDAY
uniref:CUB domain-containing protein n=1 Tax=Mola mola TaxID=94237 RepID=A0A3Q3XIU0_MOLML